MAVSEIKPAEWWEDRLRILWELIDSPRAHVAGDSPRLIYMNDPLCERLGMHLHRLPDGGRPYVVSVYYAVERGAATLYLAPALGVQGVAVTIA